MKQIVVIETIYYLAFQDGPADNEEYKTKEDAKKALRKLKEKRGVCIMSRQRVVEQ